MLHAPSTCGLASRAASGSRCSALPRTAAPAPRHVAARSPADAFAPSSSSSSGAQLPVWVTRAAAPDALSGEEPETAKEAIEFGNQLAKASRWQDALAMYEKSMTLPGTGLKRFRDKPRLVSDGERSAALFNIACCQAQLGDARAGLVALAGCLELGYDDFRQLRADPDLEPLRRDERFEGLLKRFERPAGGLGGLFGGMFGGKQ